MNDYIIYNGTNSHDVADLVITELPEMVIPEERVTFTDVPGLSGSLTQTQGTDVYHDRTLAVECYLRQPTAANIDKVAAYFRGAGKLYLPNRPDGYYEARVINQISFRKILRGRSPRSFTVNFRCKPLFRLYSGETEQTIATSGASITNPSTVQAKPKITIAGSGDITLMVGGTQIVELTGVENGIVLDSEIQEAYWGETLQNSRMSGPFPVLKPGANAISWSGGTVTSVKITPRWVTL